jgi:hypothetical protein
MIHLHHRYAIPNLHFNFNVCSVAPTASGLAALAAIASGNAPATDPAPLAIPPGSVAKITTSSRSILTLFRDSQRAALAQSIAPTLHSPQITVPSGPADVTPAQMDDILRQSPFCGCSQVIASFGSAIEVATAGQKYQVRLLHCCAGSMLMVNWGIGIADLVGGFSFRHWRPIGRWLCVFGGSVG